MQKIFNIVFQGSTLSNFDLQDVKENVQDLLSLSPIEVEYIFSGERILLLKNIDEDCIVDLKKQLERIGLFIYLEEQPLFASETRQYARDLQKRWAKTP